jgi:Ion channel
MFVQLMIGAGMIGLTVILHALSLDAIIRHLRWLEKAVLHKVQNLPWKPVTIAAIVLAIFTVTIAEIWAWAGLYYYIEAFPDFETALYFSTTAFTTVGFGDVMPIQGWRLLGAIEGANGFMLFGWSTAFTFEILSQLYHKENVNTKHPGKPNI